MDYGQIIDIVWIFVNLAGLMLCLFKYFEHTGKTLAYAVIFFLGNLLSNYYWGVYILVMNESPNVSSLLAYFGWNVAFPFLFFVMLFLRREKGRGMVSPIAMLLIPVNAAQLVIYLKYGGIFNNIWQVSWTTAAMVLALDSIVFWINNRRQGERFPYTGAAVFFYLFSEYAFWTCSCFAWPSEQLNPYNYLNTLLCVCYLIIPAAISKEYGNRETPVKKGRLMKLFKPLFIVIVIICCIGGYVLAMWMKDTLSSALVTPEGSDPYSIIAVTLFIVSAVIVSFTIMIILVVNSEKEMYEREEIERARYLAEKANTAKSDFLANMSHEIRTPINAVLGMNEMIFRESLQARDELPENRDTLRRLFSDITGYAGNVDSAGKNLLSIVNDILDFSKIEAGKLEIVDSEYHLSSVLCDITNMIRFKAENKGLEFDVEVDKDIPDGLKGDELRIRQIMTNLLNNAVKYTHTGGVTLSVSGKKYPEKDNKIFLVIAVKDTGVGIRDEDRDRLFKKFERVDIEKNSSIEGTGLGLAITGSLTEMMHGTISVNSKYGRGSTFTVSIPQEIVSGEPIGDFRLKSEQALRSMKAQKETFHAPEACILVVDDTPMNLSVVKGLLRKTMIKIDTAISGREAVRFARNRQYDIILMDQRMPEMEGTEAMRLIKGDLQGKNTETVFICLTADAVSGAKERYMSEGFTDYISKPIDSRELERVLINNLPEDKVEYRKEESVAETDEGSSLGEAKEPEKNPVSDNEDAFIDKSVGLRFCDGDEDFYKELINEYVLESDEKQKNIERTFNERDLKNYGIYTHSLKSTSKMIGAVKLSELALAMELAGKDGNEEAVLGGHEKMMEAYRGVISKLKEWL